MPAGAFVELAKKVRSGDPENIEAQAARRYWPLLFGTEFRRDSDHPGTNSLLNYGYAILRGGTARAVASAGLHPTLGLKHSNRGNPMCLVDDLMEPFRPLVDILVHRMVREGGWRSIAMRSANWRGCWSAICGPKPASRRWRPVCSG